MKKSSLFRWLPAMIIMALIFALSSIPSYQIPDFDWADLLVKKGAHMLGFGLLALAYLRALDGPTYKGGMKRMARKAWLLAVLYALADELHQSFVPGRHAAPLDVGIDAFGAALALWIWIRTRPDLT